MDHRPQCGEADAVYSPVDLTIGSDGNPDAWLRLPSTRYVFAEDVYFDLLPLVALDAPPDAALAGVKALLRAGERQGWWHYEEGCVTDAWRDA